MFDIKKYARFRPMLEALRLETVEQLYMKHKIFFIVAWLTRLKPTFSILLDINLSACLHSYASISIQKF
ncbi:hypothetical protein BpHYR1_024760 [Brachionus plicatilis]|uniref:Uncharacterized protein n=1 Tax=Brachionus plicatilis TaxID=10195 RepID=A0A3M7PLK8_BRAPC|nr:hypothetical protein BpHYR1_024760 [Brachionus plicatilis]